MPPSWCRSLGRFPLPIEVNRFGLGATRRAIGDVMAAHGAEGELRLRETAPGTPYVTDGGHLILDAFFGRISQPEALSRDLLDIAGRGAARAVPQNVQDGLCGDPGWRKKR